MPGRSQARATPACARANSFQRGHSAFDNRLETGTLKRVLRGFGASLIPIRADLHAVKIIAGWRENEGGKFLSLQRVGHCYRVALVRHGCDLEHYGTFQHSRRLKAADTGIALALSVAAGGAEVSLLAGAAVGTAGDEGFSAGSKWLLAFFE